MSNTIHFVAPVSEQHHVGTVSDLTKAVANGVIRTMRIQTISSKPGETYVYLVPVVEPKSEKKAVYLSPEEVNQLGGLEKDQTVWIVPSGIRVWALGINNPSTGRISLKDWVFAAE